VIWELLTCLAAPPLLCLSGHCFWWLGRRWWQASRAAAPGAGGIDLSRDSQEVPISGPVTAVSLATGYPVPEGYLPQGHGPRYDFSAAAAAEILNLHFDPAQPKAVLHGRILYTILHAMCAAEEELANARWEPSAN
jgi:hypothetical protein